MKAAILSIVLIALTAACGGDASLPTTAVQTTRQTESVTYIDMGASERLVKYFPVAVDPADAAEDEPSCVKAGGEWADVYFLGVLVLREPEEGAEHAGKKCWSKRQPTRFADAGKPCSGQTDCIGNCMPQMLENGKWSSPRCQAHTGEAVCGPLYDAGEYHWIDCPIP